MSGTPKKTTATAATTASGLLSVLESSNGLVTLGIQVAGVAIPLIKALIQKVEGIGTGNVTITFSDLQTQDLAELEAIKGLATADLTAINAELTRLGLPVLPNTPAS